MVWGLAARQGEPDDCLSMCRVYRILFWGESLLGNGEHRKSIKRELDGHGVVVYKSSGRSARRVLTLEGNTRRRGGWWPKNVGGKTKTSNGSFFINLRM